MKKFVIKTKGNQNNKLDFLDPADVIIEKIAYDILAFCGVTVPKTYLVQFKKPDGEIALGLASEFVENFKPLHIILETFDKVESLEGEDFRLLFEYKKSFVDKHLLLNSDETQLLPVEGMFESLPAFALILDHDAIGYGLGNGGLVEKSDKYQFIKIDPGEVNFGHRTYNIERMAQICDNFFNEIDPDLEGGLILKFFKDINVSQSKSIFRIKELFALAKKDQKIAGLIPISKIEQKDIKNIFRKKCYEKYIDSEILDEFAHVIWQRISAMKSVFSKEIIEYQSRNPKVYQKPVEFPSQHILMRPIEDFLQTKTKMIDGRSQPMVYKKIAKHSSIYNKYKNKSTSVLHQAVIKRDLNTVIALSKEGIDLGGKDCQGNTPLVYSLKNKDETMTLFLLENGGLENYDPLDDKETLLHLAAKLKNEQIFKIISKRQNNWYATDKNAKTPFDIAYENNNTPVLNIYQSLNDTQLIRTLLIKCQQVNNYVLEKIQNISRFNNQKDFSGLDLEKIGNGKSEISFKEIDDIGHLNTALKALDPMKLLIDDMTTELQKRDNDKIDREYIFYEQTFKKINKHHPFLKEAMMFEAVSIDLEKSIDNFYRKHKSFFGVHPSRDEAIKKMYDTQKLSLRNNCISPLRLLIAEIILQKNAAIKQHSKGFFSLVTKSSLATELSGILKKYNIDATLENSYVNYYRDFLYSSAAATLNDEYLSV